MKRKVYKVENEDNNVKSFIKCPICGGDLFNEEGVVIIPSKCEHIRYLLDIEGWLNEDLYYVSGVDNEFEYNLDNLYTDMDEGDVDEEGGWGNWFERIFPDIINEGYIPAGRDVGEYEVYELVDEGDENVVVAIVLP